MSEAAAAKPTDKALLYAETARCRCGAGLAYPFAGAVLAKSWTCAAVLKGDAVDGDHDAYPFAFYKVREEGSIRGRAGATTRPLGTVMRTVGYATCPKCKWRWKSEPYEAAGLNHHWFSGPCPECAYDVGSSGSYSTADGEPIETRYKSVVLDAPSSAAA